MKGMRPFRKKGSRGKKALVRLAIFSIIVTALLLVFSTAAFATTINVSAGQSIQDAINAAASGDTINIAAGTYTENVMANKPVTLAGAGASTTTISAAGGTAVTITANNVTVDGFTITNPTGKHGIYAADHSNLTITNNTVTDIGSSDATSGSNFGIAIVSSAAAVDSITITDNTVSFVEIGRAHV